MLELFFGTSRWMAVLSLPGAFALLESMYISWTRSENELLPSRFVPYCGMVPSGAVPKKTTLPSWVTG
ncbi:hypothetical protein [Sorangium sp. So ce124]|uniref:hypothetical protein n=1 Tax=Sorangium sp. So ce124 TaxID=3133280 RepID=UPI003F63C37C